MKRGTYLTAASMARIDRDLSDRDRQTVAVVARLRFVAASQIQRLFFVDGTASSNARRTRLALKRLTDQRLLYRLDRHIGGVRAGSAGHVYALDLAGAQLVRRLSGRRRRTAEPGLPFLAHQLQITELFVRLVEAERRGEVELLDFEPESEAWRYFFGVGGARMALKPDAFVRTALPGGASENLTFIEVDRATESTTALARKLRTYRQYWGSGREQARWGVFPRVLWLAPTPARVRTLIDVAGRQPAQAWKLFAIRPFDEALTLLVPKEEP